MVSFVFQGMVVGSAGHCQKCQPCLRTPVTYVSDLYTQAKKVGRPAGRNQSRQSTSIISPAQPKISHGLPIHPPKAISTRPLGPGHSRFGVVFQVLDDQPGDIDWDLWLGPAPWAPYNAAAMNRIASLIELDGARFKLNAKTFSLFWVTLAGWLITIFSLTLLAPVAGFCA